MEVVYNSDLNKQTNVKNGLFKELKELQPFALTQKECFVSTMFVSLENRNPQGQDTKRRNPYCSLTGLKMPAPQEPLYAGTVNLAKNLDPGRSGAPGGTYCCCLSKGAPRSLSNAGVHNYRQGHSLSVNHRRPCQMSDGECRVSRLYTVLRIRGS